MTAVARKVLFAALALQLRGGAAAGSALLQSSSPTPASCCPSESRSLFSEERAQSSVCVEQCFQFRRTLRTSSLERYLQLPEEAPTPTANVKTAARLASDNATEGTRRSCEGAGPPMEYATDGEFTPTDPVAEKDGLPAGSFRLLPCTNHGAGSEGPARTLCSSGAARAPATVFSAQWSHDGESHGKETPRGRRRSKVEQHLLQARDGSVPTVDDELEEAADLLRGLQLLEGDPSNGDTLRALCREYCDGIGEKKRAEEKHPFLKRTAGKLAEPKHPLHLKRTAGRANLLCGRTHTSSESSSEEDSRTESAADDIEEGADSDSRSSASTIILPPGYGRPPHRGRRPQEQSSSSTPTSSVVANYDDEDLNLFAERFKETM